MLRLRALAVLPLIGACATPGDRYPSLAIRDVERAEGQFAPVPIDPIVVPEVATPTSGPLSQRLAALAAAGAAAHRAFVAAEGRAGRAAADARGAAVGSTAWASAQVALADLDAARSRTAITLADLDTLMVAAAVQAEDLAAIEGVRQQVLADIGAEDATLARLRAQVR